MSMDNVTLENTQRSISSRDTKAVASVMVNGKWVNLSDTLEQANVNSSVGTVSKIVAKQQTVITDAVAQADSAVAYANDAIEKSRVNQQAIEDINSAVSDAVSDAAVARSDGLRAWNAAQSNVDLIDLNYASASAAISSARTEAIAAADEAKASASAAQADIVAVRSDVAAVQADVTTTKSDVAAIRADVTANKSDAAVVRAGIASDVATVRADVASNKSDISAMRANVASDIASMRADAKALTSQLDSITSNGGGRNHLRDSDKSTFGWEQDLGTMPNEVLNSLAGKTITVSVDVEWSNYQHSDSNQNRLGFELAVTDSTGVSHWWGAWKSPSTPNGKERVSATYTLPANVTFTVNNKGQNGYVSINGTGKVSHAQVEIGAIAHDWSPAPEDTDAKITAAKSDIAVVKTNLASQAASLSSYAAQASAAGQDITVLKSQAGQFEQEMADTKGDVSQLKVSASSASAALSDAAGDINKLQTDAKGTTQALADAKGDIAVLQSRADGFDTEFVNTNGDISKLQTDAKGTAQTLVDAQDDIAKLKVRADGFDTEFANTSGDINKLQADAKGTTQTLADAQDDIAKLKTRADGFDTEFANANGDISKLQTDASGTKQTLTNAKSDIAVLQSRADGYDTKFADAAGNISSLQASAKSYSAALSDAKGDIATVKATASELETKYADAAGDINQLQADAKGTAQTLADAKGDIAKLKTRADGFDTEFASTNGDISKLQVDASGTKQTLTNAKSDIAVLQSRADGFDAKYADAAGDINTIKVNAKGMQQTLTNAKGDISTLQATATGFKNTLTDAQGNISTLQSDVAGLKKTTSDHAGNIATLQADAKTLTSQMADAQGNISTLQQTASGFSSKVSGMETSLANANSKLNGITSNGGGRNHLRDSDKSTSGWGQDLGTMPNEVLNSLAGKTITVSVDVEWSNYQHSDSNQNRLGFELAVTDSTGVSHWWGAWKSPSTPNGKERVSATYTLPANVTFTVNNKGQNGYVSINGTGKVSHAQVEIGAIAHDWSPAPEDTDAKITTNTTAIEQNKKAITLKADQTTVDKTNGDVKWLQSQLKIQADQINAKVSSSDLPNLVGKGGRNLIANTGTDIVIDATSDNASDYTFASLRFTEQPKQGDLITVSAQGTLTGTGALGEYQVVLYNATITNQRSQAQYLKAGKRDSVTLSLDNLGGDGDTVLLIYAGKAGKTRGIKNVVHHLMVETGAIAHDWQPAPEDAQTYTQTQIKQTADSWNANLTSVKNGLTDKYTNLHATVDGIQAQVYNKDGSSKITQLSDLIATKVSSSDFEKLSKNVKLQTLDSADINSMRTSGHYFVHNLANTPIQGWVYVDVVGNGNDRIRQDVYQDSGIEHKYRRWFATYWTDWEEGATESEIIQLSDDINIRVRKGDVVSQINQEAGGNTLIQVSNGKGKLALNASSVVFSGSAFIPDAYITTLNADKLRFYDDSGNVATMSAGLKQYDDDKTKRSIVLKYSGGYEVHASDLLGSILTMHDNTIRLAVKAIGADTVQSDQYSGFYASQHYAQLSCYRTDGRAPGIYITDDGYTIKGDYSGNGTKYGDLNITSPQIYVQGGNSVSLSGGNAVQMQVNKTHAWLSDGMLHLYKDGDSSTTATKLQVDGWAWVNGFVEAAGHSQHSALSTKTEIQSVDDEKMLKMVNDTDLATFLYKTDVANGETHRHIGLIIDDVHDVAQYQTPQEFIAPNGVSRDDDNMIGALFGAVKALTKRIKTLESKVD